MLGLLTVVAVSLNFTISCLVSWSQAHVAGVCFLYILLPLIQRHLFKLRTLGHRLSWLILFILVRLQGFTQGTTLLDCLYVVNLWLFIDTFAVFLNLLALGAFLFVFFFLFLLCKL